MKKIFWIHIIIFLLFMANTTSAKVSSAKKDIIEGEVIELDISDDMPSSETPEQLEAKRWGGKVSKYYTFDKGLFRIHINDYLNFDFGAIGDMSWTIDDGNLHSKYYFPSTDFILSGRANKYIDYKAQIYANKNINETTILGDVWVRGKYKNYALTAGRMRKPFANEPSYSLYYNDFATKSQISRQFGDHRDTGAKILAEYKYADIALGLFAGMPDRPFDFSNHGIEFDTWVTLKPLANFKDKGDLRIAGGIATGNKDYSYTNYAGFISYNYKKLGLKAEYIYKAPTYYEEKKADGFYVDLTYKLTNKLKATLRFDSCNPDQSAGSRRNNEYVAGLNYYFNNENIMLLLNYIYSNGLTNSQRIALQLRYRTW